MSILQNTFEKHRKLLLEHLSLNEDNTKEASIQQKIERYKEDNFTWNRMAKGDFEHMIDNGRIPDEFQEYYPGWNIEDIKAVYRGVEGQDYNGY